MSSEETREVRIADYRPSDFLIDSVTLEINLADHDTRIHSTLLVRRNPQGRGGALVLDGDELQLTSILLDGQPLAKDRYEALPEQLTFFSPPEGPFRLDIHTVLDPTANTKLMGLYRSGSAYCTQCEPEGFRRITYFLDRPDVMSVYTVRLEADQEEAPVLLANGNPVESGVVSATGRHFAVWHDPFPKPSYLFALVGGRLDVLADEFITMSGRRIALGIYVEPGKAERAYYAMDALKRSMRWDETAFGREYDLDVFNIVAVSDFNMGAMENKGLNIFNDKYVLASSETATDADYAGIESVIAHEYFHNWTGNRITCRDWFQLCLKEGLTVFRDQEFSSDERSRPVKRIADVRTLRAHQFPEDAGPLAHPVRPETYREINNFYTATIYEKGAEVIRMLKRMIGDQTFRSGMDLYFERHDGDATTIEAFIACFAEASGLDLTEFMLWYAQAGTPHLKIVDHYDHASQQLRLEIKQSIPPTPGQPAKKPMPMPLALGILDEDGKEMPLVLSDGSRLPNDVLIIDQQQQTYVFQGITSQPTLSLNRGFSAPIRISSDLTDDDLLFLAQHDQDPFNRWEAIQKSALRLLVNSVAALRSDGQAFPNDRLAEALRATLADPTLEHAFIAQALTLPGETEVALEIGQDVDPDAIHHAVNALKRSVGSILKPQANGIYLKLATKESFQPDAASAGKRALCGVLLGYLTCDGDDPSARLAEAHYHGATNMTDRIQGLAALSRISDDRREKAFAGFKQRYATEVLALDKWLSIQAAIPETATLDRVRRLMDDSAFSLNNPNRIRSLIGSFSSANPTQFHRADGAGYRFVAEIVETLDPLNPQVAARLLTAFRSWRTLESERRNHAEAALRQIGAKKTLSTDVSDILLRTLA